MLYEGYGPNGIAIIVETLTDNKNRTAANVRMHLQRETEASEHRDVYLSCSTRKVRSSSTKKKMSRRDAMTTDDAALDAGAEDFVEEEDSFEIITAPDDFSAVRQALEKPGSRMEAQIAMIPQTYVELTDDQAIKDLHRTLDLLDDDDDVTDVWTNWDE